MANMTPAVYAMSPSESESASLHGHKAKTPIIAGAVSGACVGAAWIIGFIIYLYKRHRREKRARAAGFKSHREMLDPPKKPLAFIIPPDPAIIEGIYVPGERVINDSQLRPAHVDRHAGTSLLPRSYPNHDKVPSTSRPSALHPGLESSQLAPVSPEPSPSSAHDGATSLARPIPNHAHISSESGS